MDMKYCLECGAELIPNSAACPECGAPVQSISKEETKTLCPECGVELESTAEFCPECGTPIQSAFRTSEKTICPECGFELDPNAESCPECGAPVLTPSPVGVTAVSVSTAAAYAAASPVKRSSMTALFIPIAAAVAVVAVVLTIVLVIPKNVEQMNFKFDGFAGVYSGSARGGVPQGEGSWLYDNGSVRMSADGEWKNGALYEGTVNVVYNGKKLGKISYSKSEWDPGDYKAFCDAADRVNFANALR